MTIVEMLSPEFDSEMTNTRKMLERVPAHKVDWKPHEKSMILGRLAGHIAELPSWAVRIVDSESIDLTSMMSGDYKPYISDSAEELVRTFDKNVREAWGALSKASDHHLNQTWSLLMGGKTVVSATRLQMIRSMFMNHVIHHRAQLGVYLRLNNIPLPALYGPSADEGR